MIEQDPFKDFKDPLMPETVRIGIGGGKDAIDLGATAMNHAESMLPRIDSTVMREGDVLEVEFDDGLKDKFEIASLQTGSLVFGTELIWHKQIAMRRLSEPDDDTQAITFHGSAVSPNGFMSTPGTVRAGSYMITDEGVSTGAIRNFDLKRPGENGELKSVSLNQKEAIQRSESFTQTREAFAQFSELLEQNGFTFDQVDEYDLSDSYKQVNGDLLVYATRQGFASGVTPQDEIYVYDAKAEVLRGMRNIPTKDIMQTMTVEGVSKEAFQEAFIGYNDNNEPDWRHVRSVGHSGIHKLSETVPIVSYTWLSPGQEAPVVTVLEGGKNVSDLLKTPKQQGAAFVENMQAHGGEDLIDSIQETLGIDPNDNNYIYDRLEVDIYPGEQPKVHEGSDYLWQSQELATDLADKVTQAMSINYQKDNAILNIDGHIISLAMNIDQEINKMSQAMKRAFGVTQKTIGSRLLKYLRTRW